MILLLPTTLHTYHNDSKEGQYLKKDQYLKESWRVDNDNYVLLYCETSTSISDPIEINEGPGLLMSHYGIF